MVVATPLSSSSYSSTLHPAPSPCTFTRSFTPAATPPASPPRPPAPPLTRWAEEFEQAYTFVTDPTGAAQEAAASGGGGGEPPAVVWRAYPEEWIVATKPKIGPPKQVGLGVGVGIHRGTWAAPE